MNRRLGGLIAFLGLQAASVLAVSWVVSTPEIPLGIRGEWEWARLAPGSDPSQLPALLIGSGALGVYVSIALLGLASLRVSDISCFREIFWVSALFLASVGVQLGLQSAAPPSYGLTKWVTLAMPGSSGYHTVAKTQMREPARFLAEYPTWIRSQDVLHVGTHPPGLFVASRLLQAFTATFPGFARRFDATLPPSVQDGFRVIIGPMPQTDRAAIALTAFLTLLACSGTVVPLYALARGSGWSPATSWTAAALWPVVPSALLFQPTADTAFPLLTTGALAMVSTGGWVRAFTAGLILAVGMQFTLAFLPVGLIVAIMLAWRSGKEWRSLLVLLGATGAGFFLPTLIWWGATAANPFSIWWTNQANHARFYVEYPRSYRGWVAINSLEFLVALGLPAACWAVLGFVRTRFSGSPSLRASWATLFVLVILNLSGRNLSEVARLWIPLMPPFLLAAAAGFEKVGGQAWLLGTAVVLTAVQFLILQSGIQVVFPV